ncbi:MAG: CarD family transcriptional regulator [Rickettsiales bacterium]|nr:CarD family transcriptional regulator [Rickettsiales bacterium]
MKKDVPDLNLEIGDLVVYPTYGVGQIEEFDTHHIDGTDHDFVLINFKQDKMKLRIPMNKTANSGLRKLSNKNRLSKALEVLKEDPNLKKDMWIKRAKEYEKSINSGDPVLIAEVVRDLHKKDELLEQQSYSERQIYLTALNRLSNEYAAVENIDKKVAKKKLEELLNS